VISTSLLGYGETDGVRIIDHWSQPGTFAAMPEAFQDYCRSTVFTNILDWRSASGFTSAITDFATVDVPTTIVRGQYANQSIVEISANISQQIDGCVQKVVSGSNHFLISTHPRECAAIIDAHMSAL
jgi:pimeloyl-ACP methyl ester carboxylesterase